MPTQAPGALPGFGAGPSARRLFWRIQLGGWLLFGVVFYLTVLPGSSFDPVRLLVFKLLWALTGVAVSTGLAYGYRALHLVGRSPWMALGVTTGAAAVAALLWVGALGGAALLLTGSTAMLFTATSFPFVAWNHVFILVAWSGGYLTLSLWQRSTAAARKSLEAMSLAREAQLEMLRYQLNPHFLFNAISSVRALIPAEPARARETLTRLSDFLRYTLTRRNGATVTVAEEAEIVTDYLAIEHVRYEDRLAARVDIDPRVADYRIPGFLLHSLVENAVKHGVPAGGRLEVDVRATLDGTRLCLEVSNSGTFTPDAAGTGIGLENVRARLAAMYPGRHTVAIGEGNGRVRAVVTIDLDADPRAG